MEGKVIVIVGPTAVGKSDLALRLAQRLSTEIISADSRQIFKYMDIGTAKPSPQELKKVKHHFIDYLEPCEYYNVSKFESEALDIIKTLTAAGKTPIVVGGSGLYVKALIDGIIDLGETNFELRERLWKIRREEGNEALYERLKTLDPKAAATMLPQNWKRVIRAIEVFEETGRSIVDLHKAQKKKNDFNFVQFGLRISREKLYERIENRVDEMLKNGLVEEVERLLKMGFSPECNALNTVGYKEIISFLKGEYDFTRTVELIKRNTRRYAKRQLTWFGRDERIYWMDGSKSVDELVDYIIGKMEIGK